MCIIKHFPFFVISLFLFISCGSSNEVKEATKGNKTVAADVLDKTNLFANDTVQIKCVFLGWKGKDCKFSEKVSHQIKRNDWLVKWDNECVYVTGGSPSFVELFDNTYSGKNIELTAIIRLNKNGQVYFEYIDCRVLVSN